MCCSETRALFVGENLVEYLPKWRNESNACRRGRPKPSASEEASACSGVTRTLGAVDAAAGFAGADSVAIRVPHFLQNLAPG